MEKKVRSWYFVVSGGLGGIVGFVLMEIALSHAGGNRTGEILRDGDQLRWLRSGGRRGSRHDRRVRAEEPEEDDLRSHDGAHPGCRGRLYRWCGGADDLWAGAEDVRRLIERRRRNRARFVRKHGLRLFGASLG